MIKHVIAKALTRTMKADGGQMKPATPLPWSTEIHEEKWAYVRDADTNLVLDGPKFSGLSLENAAYIVHACNNYPKLVEICKAAAGGHYQVRDGRFTTEAAVALLAELGE